MDSAPGSSSWAFGTWTKRKRSRSGTSSRSGRSDLRGRGNSEMGEIVAAVATCHTPYLFTRPPDEDPAQLDQAAAAMQELGKVLDESRPDAIIFLGSDHVET